jgi:exodeoxyribonuclease-3
MKKCFIMCLIFFVVFSANAQEKYNLKVLTYNIWNGFDFGKDTLRSIKLGEWVDSKKPDVLALQELCSYTPEKLKEEALRWGHPYSFLLKTTGYSVGITSKFPIELKEKILEGMHHGALHCKIKGIDFLVIHLHPGSIKRRQEETKILLKKIEEIKGQNLNYMVLGDFNSHSPFDSDLYDPNGDFLKGMRISNKGKGLDGNMVDDNLDYSVISSFLSISLNDVVQRYSKGMSQRGSFPALALASNHDQSIKEFSLRLERLDYILVSPNLGKSCKNAQVFNKEDTGYLSDHYPVFAEFEINQ